ncbi:hypothetical protein DCAR_0415392 [Daucus carota subsp. sativus]|uniref:Uncharacterized protein n=1 Tax=Daucus carota subsp. sativus TaxID=79200 RepID=A0A162A7C7_DAUCS|nr:hypothetical protein DCAR_0415392 [Daucus carota subsp. sativus]
MKGAEQTIAWIPEEGSSSMTYQYVTVHQNEVNPFHANNGRCWSARGIYSYFGLNRHLGHWGIVSAVCTPEPGCRLCTMGTTDTAE